MAVSRDEVLRVASLARLELDPGEVERMTLQLNRILEHVDALVEAEEGSRAGGGEGGETSGPAAAPGVGEPSGDDGPGTFPAPLRADTPGADPLAFGPEAMAPGWADGFFTVPLLASHAEPPPERDPGSG